MTSDGLTWGYTITIPANETRRLLLFTTQAENRSSAAAETASLAALPAQSLANLTPEELATIVNFRLGDPLRATGRVPEGSTTDVRLTAAELTAAWNSVVQSLGTVGGSSDALRQLRSASIGVADLPADMLALTVGNVVYVDQNAAGYGWFVDRSPQDSNEFLWDPSTGIMRAVGIDAASNRMDLLTVVMHELGHLLGLEHENSNPEDVMNELLPSGHRRAFSVEQIDKLFSLTE